MSKEILDCLKRQRDICIKNILPSQNTAFMCTPALTQVRAEFETPVFLFPIRNIFSRACKTARVFTGLLNGRCFHELVTDSLLRLQVFTLRHDKRNGFLKLYFYTCH